MLSWWWGRVKDRRVQTGTSIPSSGDEALEFGGCLGDDDRAVWGTPPRNSAEFIGSGFLAHTQNPGRASIQFHARHPVVSKIPSLPLHRLDHSQPGRPPLGIFHRSPAGAQNDFNLFVVLPPPRACNGPGFGGQWLPASLMAVSACHRRHRPETSPSPNGPGAAKERERKKKHRPLDRAFLRLTGRSAGRPACNSIGSRTPNTHFQL